MPQNKSKNPLGNPAFFFALVHKRSVPIRSHAQKDHFRRRALCLVPKKRVVSLTSIQELKTADQVGTKASEEAYLSLADHLKTRARLHWKHVTLPQPMDADCKRVAGKVHGPPNHKLCEFHDHIFDMETKMVIVHSLEEYRKLIRKK